MYMFWQWWMFLHQILHNTPKTTEISKKNHTFVCKYTYPRIQKNRTLYTRGWRLFLWLYPLLYFLKPNHFANGFFFHLQVARMSLLSHLVHLKPVYIFRSYFHHIIFNTVLAPCPGISNGLLPQAWQTKIFYSFLPLTSTTW